MIEAIKIAAAIFLASLCSIEYSMWRMEHKIKKWTQQYLPVAPSDIILKEKKP